MNTVATPNYRGDSEEQINFGALIDTLFLERKLVVAIAATVMLLGIGYAILATPIYEADLSVQIEDSPTSAKSMLGDVSSMFDTKTAASAEIEILRSRMVVAKAVDNLGLHISAQPRYLPLFGRWLAQRSHSLSSPLLGRVSGNEDIEVAEFHIPSLLQDLPFTLVAEDAGGYQLTLPEYDIVLAGKVGVLATEHTEHGDIELLVKALHGKAGASFELVHGSRLKSIETLQDSLMIAEQGKQSGVIGIHLEGSNPVLATQILNELGTEYIRQNVYRKSEEAQKTLDFLDKELPKIKQALDAAENRYNHLRDTRGTIDIGAEGKGLLDQSVGIEVKLVELQQKRDELLVRYTEQHPSVVIIDGQMRVLSNKKLILQDQVKRLPGLQQDMLSLERDVKVNTELYTSLLNSAQQLNLLKASKVGTARMIDLAVVPEASIKPKRGLIVVLSIFMGLFLGVVVVFIRKALQGGIDDPKVIEEATGLPVYATILESAQQEIFAKKIKDKQAGVFVLAQSHPDDLAIESLRSFRVALQFAMLDASNNRIMITGASPGLGKSFIAANMAAILAQAGKRVLLLDIDLHKGHLNQYFGVSRNGGVSEVLAADKTLNEVIHSQVLPNLDLMTIGARVSNPSALFLSGRLAQMLDEVSERYDVVMIDAPPVLLVSDVSVIAPHVGTTFLVVRDNLSTLADIQASQQRLAQARISVKGVLFNGQLKRMLSSYGYGYGYKYGNYKQSGGESRNE